MIIKNKQNVIIFEGNGANLRGADLCGADLYGVDLRGTDLREADLREADLRRADLREVDLRGVNLCEADLCGVDLRGVNLCEADLWGANLRYCIGNGKEIKTIQSGTYLITFSSTSMAIDGNQHDIEAWFSFDDIQISKMDSKALKWWTKWRPILKTIMESDL